MAERTIRYKLSKEVRFHEISKGVFVGWNRFFPKLFKLNKDAVLFLRGLDKIANQEAAFKEIPTLKNELLNQGFLCKDRKDTSKEDFFKLIDKEYQRINRKAEEFYSKERQYSQLYIHNDFCNLGCPYCAKNYKNIHPKAKIKPDEKRHSLNLIIDQYIDRKIKNNITVIPICFNGGEILLEWDLVKTTVERNREKYPSLSFKYFVNTNMTLMNEEISEFMSRYDFDVDISIDGHQAAHDLTRVYGNGQGSFNDVLEGLKIFGKYNKNSPINSFQGTIENSDAFQPHEVFNMKQFGFEKARLAPNLLNISLKDASKKTIIMKKLLELNLSSSFKVSDTYFDNIRTLLDFEEYKFHLTCVGLSGLPLMGIYFNISTLRLSQLCSYLSKPTIHMKDLDYDIYNPELWKVTRNFIKDRLEAIKGKCSECDVIGICRGDCVMRGLDTENQLNKAACHFQREMWKLFLVHMYNNEMEAGVPA